MSPERREHLARVNASVVDPQAELMCVAIDIDHPMRPQFERHIFPVGTERELNAFMEKLAPQNLIAGGGTLRITNVYIHERKDPQPNEREEVPEVQSSSDS